MQILRATAPLAPLALLLLGPSACADLEELDTNDSAHAATTDSSDWGSWGSWGAWGGCLPYCGTNSTLLDGVPFPELSTKGKANSFGVSLVATYNHLGKSVKLGIDEDVLTGNGVPLQEGSMLVVNIAGPGGGTDHDLIITEVGLANHWVDWTADPVTTYRIQYDAVVDEQDLCPDLYSDDGIPMHHFVAFGGERYNHELKEIADGAIAANWINFACTGTAISKLHLQRHTAAGANLTHSTTLAQRQAMLKMYTADYCGTGKAYTKTGQPIAIEDDLGWLPGIAGTTSREAVWDENGALCLDTPRLVSPADVACNLPSCAIYPGNTWTTDGHLRTANP